MTAAPARRWLGFPEVLSAVFFVVTLLQISRHIMWRDELRPWQIIQECSGPISTIQAMRYDSVPVLWNFIVFVLTRITRNPFLMQFVHLLLATAVVWVIARWSPFSRLTKTLFVFGYFPFYEYAVISRNYVLVFLLMMIACVLISQPRVKLIHLGIVLGLLTQASIWGAGLAGLFLLAGIGKAFWTDRSERPPLWQPAVAAGIVLVGVGLCFAVVFPGPGPTFTATWLRATPMQKVVGTVAAIYRGWFPIPQMGEHFWNTNILDSYPGWQGFLGLTLLIGGMVLFIDRPIALGVLLGGALGLMVFEFRFRGSARHHGHIFMLLVAACWLASSSRSWMAKPSLTPIRKYVLISLLGLHALIGVSVACIGLVVPFSASWATAQFIKQNYSDKIVLVAVDDYCAAPIATWLDKQIYYPQMRAFARCNTQNPDLRYGVDMQSLIEKIYELAATNQTDVILLFSSGRKLLDRDANVQLPPTPTNPRPELRIRVLPTFDRGVVADESEALYLFSINH